MRVPSWIQTDLSEARLHASDDVPLRLGSLELKSMDDVSLPGQPFRQRIPLPSIKTRIGIRGTGDHDFLHSCVACKNHIPL